MSITLTPTQVVKRLVVLAQNQHYSYTLAMREIYQHHRFGVNITQRVVDRTLVDFINTFAKQSGLDYSIQEFDLYETPDENEV